MIWNLDDLGYWESGKHQSHLLHQCYDGSLAGIFLPSRSLFGQFHYLSAFIAMSLDIPARLLVAQEASTIRAAPLHSLLVVLSVIHPSMFFFISFLFFFPFAFQFIIQPLSLPAVLFIFSNILRFFWIFIRIPSG